MHVSRGNSIGGYQRGLKQLNPNETFTRLPKVYIFSLGVFWSSCKMGGGGEDRLIGVRAHCQPSRTALLSPDQHSVTTLQAFWKMCEGNRENLSGVRVRMHFSLDFPVSSLFRWTTGIQSSGSARDSRREKTWVMINTVWLRHYCLWQRVGASPKQCLSTWQ